MPVPDYQSLYLPLLKALADGKEHAVGDLRDVIAKQLHLSEKDLSEMLPSGRQPVFQTGTSAWGGQVVKIT